MPAKPEPGKSYPFTIIVTAEETSGNDKTKKLHASGSLQINVLVKKDRKPLE